jgi:hypothetical protein
VTPRGKFRALFDALHVGQLSGTILEALMEHRVDGQTAEDEHGDEGDYPRPSRQLLSCAKPDCE